MAETIIRTIDIKRTFGSTVAVRNLNLHVSEGSIYGFLGPNGAGKTTTIRMLLGLIRPTAGSIEILGRRVDQHRRELLSSIGTLVETPSYYLHLTGRENIQLIAGMRGGRSSQGSAARAAYCRSREGFEQAGPALLARHAPAPWAGNQPVG